MSYLVVKSASNATPESYQLTSTANKPRLAVGGSYIPLTPNDTLSGIKVKDNNSTYRVMSYRSSSSSSSIMETTGYSGVSSQKSYYQTTLNNSAGLSSVTQLTRSSAVSTKSYTGAVVTAYSGISSRRSDYYTSAYAPGNMSYITYLTEARVTNIVYGYVTIGEAAKSSNNGAVQTSWTNWYGTVTAIQQGYLYGYYTCTRLTSIVGRIVSSYSHTDSAFHTWALYSSATRQVATGTTSYWATYTTGYSGISSQRSDYYTSDYSPGNMSYVTNLTQAQVTRTELITTSSVSAYAGSSSKRSDYYTSSTERANMSSITDLTSSASASGSTTTWV